MTMTVGERIDQAFDHRGYVTVRRQDGTSLVGFVYDRGPAHIEMYDETAALRIRVAVDEIADVELTGEDTAAKAQSIWERRKGALEPSETSPWGGWDERPVLILVALPMELGSVADALGSRIRGGVVRGRVGGVGAVGLAVGMGGGAAQVVAAERPRLVVSCGFSGGLDPSLRTGDLVLASSVRDEVGDSIPVDESVLRAAWQALGAGGETRVAESKILSSAEGGAPHKGPLVGEILSSAAEGGAPHRGPLVGEILCATRVAATAVEKRALARPGRLAVDLESGPAARAAVRAGVPWLAVRVILDPIDADMPAFTREAHSTYVVPALRHALGGPRAVAQLARLAMQARTATRSLVRAVRRLGSLTLAEARP